MVSVSPTDSRAIHRCTCGLKGKTRSAQVVCSTSSRESCESMHGKKWVKRMIVDRPHSIVVAYTYLPNGVALEIEPIGGDLEDMSSAALAVHLLKVNRSHIVHLEFL